MEKMNGYGKKGLVEVGLTVAWSSQVNVHHGLLNWPTVRSTATIPSVFPATFPNIYGCKLVAT